MIPRIIFAHGNDTEHWSGSWAHWLKNELGKRGYPTFFETFPDSIMARAKYWIPFLGDHIKAGENDVIVGWSSGAVAAMKYTEIHRLFGSILISPSATDGGDELEEQSGYYDTPWNWDAIKKNQERIDLIYSDDDPYIPQSEFELIGDKLGATVHKLSGKKHFIGDPTFRELLDVITKQYPVDK